MMSAISSPLHEWPQITNGALEWLDSFLTPNSSVFEWGSGGSTLYIVKRVEKIISIEHNPQWWKKVTDMVKAQGIGNYKCVLVEPEPITESGASLGKSLVDMKLCWDPHGLHRVTRRQLDAVTFSYEKYVKAICGYPDATFDLVFIDGFARTSCMLYGRSKVKPGGFLMLDDAQMRQYQDAKQLLADWKATDFRGIGKYIRNKAWSTMVWERSSDSLQ